MIVCACHRKCVCVCEREREREREKERVIEGEKEREKEGDRETSCFNTALIQPLSPLTQDILVCVCNIIPKG